MNKIILRVLCVLLALSLLTLCACGRDDAAQQSTAPAESTAAETTAGGTTAYPSETSKPSTEPATSAGESTSAHTGTTRETAATTTKTAVTTKPATTKPADTVSLTVQCHKAVEYIEQHNIEGYERIVPANGIMLQEKSIPLQNGDSVLSVLKRVLDARGMVYKADGGYVSNIGGLAAKAKAFGEQSGWLYSVNGVTPPNISSAAYQLKVGDEVEFRFVTEYTPF